MQSAIDAVIRASLDINTEIQMETNALWKELEADLKITSTDGLANWSLDSSDVEECYVAPREEVEEAVNVLERAYNEQSEEATPNQSNG